MKRIAIIFMFVICMFFAGCEQKEGKRPTTTYAVKYTIELKDGPKTVIELLTFDSRNTMALYCKYDKDNDLNRLIMYSISDGPRKEICATRFRISSYGISNWYKDSDIKQ